MWLKFDNKCRINSKLLKTITAKLKMHCPVVMFAGFAFLSNNELHN